MKSFDWAVILNFSFVITHQIDAAYWHEWEMFQMPGGIQLFNILNLLIFIVLLACLVPVIRRAAAGFYCSLVLVAASCLIILFHSGFALLGYEQFNLPVSIFVIVGSFLAALLQFILTLKNRQAFSAE